MSDDKTIPEEIDPQYLFQTVDTRLLAQIVNKEIDPVKLAENTLVTRGQDNHGDWIGFEQSSKLFKQRASDAYEERIRKTSISNFFAAVTLIHFFVGNRERMQKLLDKDYVGMKFELAEEKDQDSTIYWNDDKVEYSVNIIFEGDSSTDDEPVPERAFVWVNFDDPTRSHIGFKGF